MTSLDELFRDDDDDKPSPSTPAAPVTESEKDAKIRELQAKLEEKESGGGLSIWAKLIGCVLIFLLVMFIVSKNNDGSHDHNNHDDQEQVDPDGGPVIGDEVKVVIVEESEERPGELSVVMRYKAWRESLESRNVSFDVVDREVESGSLAPYVSEATGKKLPWLMISVDGKIVVSQQFPESKADEVINELLKQKTGR